MKRIIATRRGWRQQQRELAALRAENVRLQAELTAATFTIGQLQQDYQFYFDAYCTSTREDAHAR